MSDTPRLVVVVPFQNEQALLPRLLASIDGQTRRPDELVLVDDGSTDRSGELARAYAADHAATVFLSRPPRLKEADRLSGAHELQAFQWAVEQLREPWDVIAKLDADLELNPRHFEHMLHVLEGDPLVGITGADLSDVGASGIPLRQAAPAWHVHGATKFYRRECFEEIQPIPAHLGWDMIDGAKARKAGWKTVSVEIPGGDTLHLRPTGAHDGRGRAFMRWGECAWGYGAHPLWIVLGMIKRARWRPYVLGGFLYGVGYGLAALRRAPRAEDGVIEWVRAEEAAEVQQRLRRVFPFIGNAR